MNSKEYLTNRKFCPIPWTGLMYNFDGNVKNCIRSAGTIGNIQNDSIEDIVNGKINSDTRIKMLSNNAGPNCFPCYDIEQEKNKFDIISDRTFYLRELKQIPLELYNNSQQFDLHTIDIRWTNLCNFSCVYCGPEFSSKWANELDIKIDVPTDTQRQKFKNFILDQTKKLRHVYLAGGEPLLMKENLELLEKLYKDNPQVSLRINTNLSKVDTKVFELISKFKNVHWTVSVETIENEYEYIRYGGSWQEFVDNLHFIKNLNHKISFNMLHFLLNYESIFVCIDFLKGIGFHNNSFIAGPITSPEYLDVRHLPDTALLKIKNILETRINQAPGFLLNNSYKNLRSYLEKSMIKNLSNSFNKIEQIDKRRNLNSRIIFKELYQYE